MEEVSAKVVIEIPLDQIQRSPGQIRKALNQEALAGLSRSMNEVGLLHPILVKQTATGYQMVAGERRLAAAEALGYKTIAASVLSDEASVRQVQLVENIQREDLNPVERAQAVRSYMDEESLSKVGVSKKLAIPRTTLTDWLDLLEVDERYQRAVVDNFYGGDSPLTPSHVVEARALASRLNSQGVIPVLLDAVLRYKLSKSQTREIAKMVRENRDVSLEDAIRIVRYIHDEASLAEEDGDGLWPAERNLQELLNVLNRSGQILTKMEHLSARFLASDTKNRLMEGFQRLHDMAEEAMQRMSQPPAPPKQASTKSRGNKKKKKIQAS